MLQHQRAQLLHVAKAKGTMDTASDAYVAITEEGIAVEWNRQAEQIFGWSHAEVIGKNLTEIFVPPLYREAHEQRLKHFFDTTDGPVHNNLVELRALHRDGRQFPIEATIWLVKTGSTRVLHGFLHNISERQRSMRRLAAVTQVSATLLEAPSLNEGAPKILHEIGTTLGWAVGALWVFDPSVNLLRCSEFWHDEKFAGGAFEKLSRALTFAPGVGLPGRIWSVSAPLWDKDVTTHHDAARASAIIVDGLHGAFGFPIISDGKVAGVIEFLSAGIQEPDPELLKMMGTLGSLIGQFMARIEAKNVLEKEGAFLAALLENLSDGIVACDQHGTLSLFNQAARELLGLPELPLPPEKWSEHYHVYLTDGETPMPTEQLPLYRAFVGESVRDAEVMVIPPNSPRRYLVCNGRALVSSSGQKLGAVVAFHDISEHREAEERLLQMAHFDPLTALPNRTLFYESLQKALVHAQEHHCIVSVMFLDLDRFKEVNDTLGHAAGDELLRQVGNRLVDCLRVRDTVGRLGGDEFGIILLSPRGAPGAQIVATKINVALRPPFEILGHEVSVTASIGIALYPEDGLDTDILMKYADTAMYQAKAAGRDAYRFYKAEMNARALEKLELENALRKALANNEFVLHYQPKMKIDSGEWAGVEALLRWNRPGHGLVSPANFIPLLEETGLIVPVGSWVINNACHQIAEWRRLGVGLIRVAVNVSGKQFMKEDLVFEITSAMKKYGIGVGLLEIEITESSLMEDAEKTHLILRELNSLGIAISVDDFGTGYSSLAYLSRFWIDTLKIDIAFIRNVTTNSDSAAIATAIISMAHSLKLNVVAEGVETKEQLEFLRMNDCDEIQGYLISKPLPLTELMTRLGKTPLNLAMTHEKL